MSAEAKTETAERVVAATLRDAKVGEFVLYRRQRGAAWVKLRVAKIGPQSVFANRLNWRGDETEDDPLRFCRTPDPENAEPFQRKYGTARGRDYGIARGADEVEKLEHAEREAIWASDHRHKILEHIKWKCDVVTLRKVAALIGYHDTAAKDCKQ